MADVTGPISSLPGSSHQPQGKCDEHPDRDAAIRVQGETDSFGCEMIDTCDDCHREYKELLKVEQVGTCDWCKQTASDLRPRRDYEEGMSGRVYDVCGDCVKKENEELAAERDYQDLFTEYYREDD